jgi:ketosteroid isomerase-like protein
LAEVDVAAVRMLLDALGQGRYRDAAARLTEDAEWHNTERFPGPTVCRGRKEIEAFWEQLFEAYVEVGPATDLVRLEHGDGVVAAELHAASTGRASGVPLEVRWSHVYRVRDGLVARVETYGRYESALEASGLG